MSGTPKKLAELISAAEKFVVFTGAGMSTESGLADFRSSEGLWRGKDPRKTASREAMKENTEDFCDFYRWRLEQLRGVVPHQGYRILAEWEEKGLLKGVITQNVDGFHKASGSIRTAELHGRLNALRCDSCGKNHEVSDFFAQKVPRCSCGGILRPGVVLFGESLPREAFELAERITAACDLFLVLGSSLEVSPANMFPLLARQNGACLFIVNRENTPYDDRADYLSREKAGVFLRETDEALGNIL